MLIEEVFMFNVVPVIQFYNYHQEPQLKNTICIIDECIKMIPKETLTTVTIILVVT